MRLKRTPRLGSSARLAACLAVAGCVAAGHAQTSTLVERLTGFPVRVSSAAPLPPPEGLSAYITDQKLLLSLDAAIRLALKNNTDIKIAGAPVQLARNGLHSSYAPFDPSLTSSFLASRSTTPSTSQLQGAAVEKNLQQTTQVSYQQAFQTGTSFETHLYAYKYSTNSQYYFLNPSIGTTLQFTVSQPLLRNFGLSPNRAPILIAQRTVRQAHFAFAVEVNSVVLNTVQQYWRVIFDRENLAVQRKSLEAAQQSYARDMRSLSLGAVARVDTYRSEAQVAARKLSVIQAEYALKQDEDILRRFIGADLDTSIQLLDLELTESPEPQGEMLSVDVADSQSSALANRPEVELSTLQLANDELSVRLAHNNLRPNLVLSGTYSGSGLGGTEYDLSAVPPVQLSKGGFTNSLAQTLQFEYPNYTVSLSLTLPIKNHAAEYALGNAEVNRNNDQYLKRSVTQSIMLDVQAAVNQVEQAKLSIGAAKASAELARKSLHAEERKQELGDESVFFVLQAQTDLAQAEAALVQAEVNYQQAVANLERATGDLLHRHNIQLSQ